MKENRDNRHDGGWSKDEQKKRSKLYAYQKALLVQMSEYKGEILGSKTPIHIDESDEEIRRNAPKTTKFY